MDELYTHELVLMVCFTHQTIPTFDPLLTYE